MNFLAPHWEYPATVWCAHCHEPLELTWSSSAVGHKIYHSICHKITHLDMARKPHDINEK